ncbi:hypothetical protein CaCOL14_009785 [Colletotrichum acutatum]
MQPYLARPGMETGVFYIPIANLPFDTNWRQFKDWLREGCVVDHVQIFGPSTSGWIRVMGQHNFYGACDRLKEGVFHGRRIMFDDRNMSNPIMIKDVERQTISRLVRIRMIPIQKHRVLSGIRIVVVFVETTALNSQPCVMQTTVLVRARTLLPLAKPIPPSGPQILHEALPKHSA